jgi:hypothetical protein
MEANEMDVRQLTALFERLGAREPEGWARSQVGEGTPQLARFLFLRQAWRSVVAEDDPTWIDAAIRDAEAHSEGPFAGVGHALKRLRAAGATSQDLTDLVRGMQAQLLSSLCYLLEDSGEVEAEVSNIAWALFQIDKEGEPLAAVTGLHESVLETDPTGREMRPRGTAA